MKYDNPFLQYADILDNRNRLKAVLLDFFPDERVKANVLLTAYDSGITGELYSAEKINNMFVTRFIKRLLSEYAVQKEMAEWSVKYWIEMYGVQVLKKDVDLSLDLESYTETDEYEDTSFEISETTDFSSRLNNSVLNTSIEKLADGEKIEKNKVNIDTQSFKKIGIESFKCSVRKEYVYDYEASLKITGEYQGETNDFIIIVIMCFNYDDEMIGATFNDTITSNFKGSSTYSTSMFVPKWENIKRIDVRAILNPSTQW